MTESAQKKQKQATGAVKWAHFHSNLMNSLIDREKITATTNAKEILTNPDPEFAAFMIFSDSIINYHLRTIRRARVLERT